MAPAPLPTSWRARRVRDRPLRFAPSYALLAGQGCKLVTDNSTGHPSTDKPLDFAQHLASFLLLRGPYAWLGWAWLGCSGSRGVGGGDVPIPPTPKEMFATDYGTPTGLCHETADHSGVFTRDWTKATVRVDCNKWEGTIVMKATGRSVFER